MADKFENEDFGSSENLLDYLKERSDDFEKAIIFGPGAVFSSPDRKQGKRMANFGIIFVFVNGENKLVGKDDAEMVLNDGILSRMKIKIEFLQ